MAEIKTDIAIDTEQEVSIEVRVVCRECNTELEARWDKDKVNPWLEVQACPICIAEATKQGREDGIAEASED